MIENLINACEVWGTGAEIQVSKRKFYTHIHLDYVIVEILSKKKPLINVAIITAKNRRIERVMVGER